MGEAIVITSGKGGSGKSTLAVHLGVFMAEAGRKVALVDMDMGMRSLDVMLGLENKVVYDLADVAEGVCRVKQALVRHPKYENLSLLSAAQTRGSGSIAPRQAAEVIEKLKAHFDCVLIDCPAGVDRGFLNAIAGADRAVVVALMDPVSLRDAERVVGLLERGDILKPVLVLNRALPASFKAGAPMTAKDFEERLGIRLIGLVPEQRDLPGALLRGEAVAEKTEAGAAMRRIARRLMGEDVPLEPIKRPSLPRRLKEALFGL